MISAYFIFRGGLDLYNTVTIQLPNLNKSARRLWVTTVNVTGKYHNVLIYKISLVSKLLQNPISSLKISIQTHVKLA
jgi:hypothetical protein